MTSSPVCGSRKKFPLIPCTEGGTPVVIEALFTLVKDGRAPRAIERKAPDSNSRASSGMRPRASEESRYSLAHPSMQMTANGRAGGR